MDLLIYDSSQIFSEFSALAGSFPFFLMFSSVCYSLSSTFITLPGEVSVKMMTDMYVDKSSGSLLRTSSEYL